MLGFRTSGSRLEVTLLAHSSREVLSVGVSAASDLLAYAALLACLPLLEGRFSLLNARDFFLLPWLIFGSLFSVLESGSSYG